MFNTNRLPNQEHRVVIKAGINDWHEDGQLIIPTKFIIHPGWDSNLQVNDIAIVRVKDPIMFTAQEDKYIVNAVCLPEPESDVTDSKAKLCGWGQVGENEGQSDWLQKITLPIFKRERCKYSYREYMEIKVTHICAGGKGGEDSCMV